MRTFRTIWTPLADCVTTHPHQSVTFYPGPEDRRMRVTVNMEYDTVTVFRNVRGRWELVCGYRVLNYFPPKRLAALIRKWLAKEMQESFPDQPTLMVHPIPGCRGRLRVVTGRRA